MCKDLDEFEKTGNDLKVLRGKYLEGFKRTWKDMKRLEKNLTELNGIERI